MKKDIYECLEAANIDHSFHNSIINDDAREFKKIFTDNIVNESHPILNYKNDMSKILYITMLFDKTNIFKYLLDLDNTIMYKFIESSTTFINSALKTDNHKFFINYFLFTIYKSYYLGIIKEYIYFNIENENTSRNIKRFSKSVANNIDFETAYELISFVGRRIVKNNVYDFEGYRAKRIFYILINDYNSCRNSIILG